MKTHAQNNSTADYAANIIRNHRIRIEDKIRRSTTPKTNNVQNVLGWPPRKVQPTYVDPVTRWNREAAFTAILSANQHSNRIAMLARWGLTHPFFMKFPQPFNPKQVKQKSRLRLQDSTTILHEFRGPIVPRPNRRARRQHLPTKRYISDLNYLLSPPPSE